MELHESREQVNQNPINYLEKIKSLFDRKARDKSLQPGDLVEREDKGKHGNFDPLWFGPFNIVEEKGNNTFLLENLEGEVCELPMNENFLKLYLQH